MSCGPPMGWAHSSMASRQDSYREVSPCYACTSSFDVTCQSAQIAYVVMSRYFVAVTDSALCEQV